MGTKDGGVKVCISTFNSLDLSVEDVSCGSQWVYQLAKKGVPVSFVDW